MALILKIRRAQQGRCGYEDEKQGMLEKWNLDDCDVEFVKVALKQAEYDEKIVRLVKVLLEIDEMMDRIDDAVLVEKEAA